MNVKIICLSGVSASRCCEYLNHKSNKYHFSRMLIDEEKNEKEAVDYYILNPIFTKNIINDFKMKVGSSKVIVLSKDEYRDRDIILSLLEGK